MLHQFPTRMDLMMFVVQSVFGDEVAIYDQRLQAIDDPKERLYAFPEIVWAARGLSIAKVPAPDPEGIEKSVTLLRRLFEVYAERPRQMRD